MKDELEGYLNQRIKAEQDKIAYFETEQEKFLG